MNGLRMGGGDRTGTSAPTIRYYEQIGLLRRAPRQAGTQRVYTRDDSERLTFIRRCREFDFSSDQLSALVALLDDRRSSCMGARDLAASHLDAIRAKMGELKWLEKSLVPFVHACDTSCAGGSGLDCVILGDLGKGCGCEPHAS